MTRNSNALMRDGSVMAHSDLVYFLSGSTDSARNFSGSADLHIPIHPPQSINMFAKGVCETATSWKIILQLVAGN